MHRTASTGACLERKGRQAGFWALEVPAEHGGNDVGQLAMCLINEELFKHPAMFEFGGSPEPALYLCNDEQKQRFFYPIIKGEKHSCYAFTEPDAGVGSRTHPDHRRARRK